MNYPAAKASIKNKEHCMGSFGCAQDKLHDGAVR